MARKKFSADQIAQILVEAMFTSDQIAAAQHGIATRTIERWRDKINIDTNLSRLVEIKRQAFQRRWIEKAGAFLDQDLEYLHKAAQTQNVTPEMIHALAGALKIVSEIITIREVLDARLTGQNREDDPQD